VRYPGSKFLFANAGSSTAGYIDRGTLCPLGGGANLWRKPVTMRPSTSWYVDASRMIVPDPDE
jgi:hypothetical protein